jgi:hypothetical protein
MQKKSVKARNKLLPEMKTRRERDNAIKKTQRKENRDESLKRKTTNDRKGDIMLIKINKGRTMRKKYIYNEK